MSKYLELAKQAVLTRVGEYEINEESAQSPQPARAEPPAKRCRTCNGYVFWRSTHGAVICVVCHPPATRELVKEWVWVEEGAKKIQ